MVSVEFKAQDFSVIVGPPSALPTYIQYQHHSALTGFLFDSFHQLRERSIPHLTGFGDPAEQSSLLLYIVGGDHAESSTNARF